MEAHAKFNIKEVVLYKNNLYVVEAIHAINWSLSNPIVYELVRLDAKPTNPLRNKQLLVREPLVKKVPKELYERWKKG